MFSIVSRQWAPLTVMYVAIDYGWTFELCVSTYNAICLHCTLSLPLIVCTVGYFCVLQLVSHTGLNLEAIQGLRLQSFIVSLCKGDCTIGLKKIGCDHTNQSGTLTLPELRTYQVINPVDLSPSLPFATQYCLGPWKHLKLHTMVQK